MRTFIIGTDKNIKEMMTSLPYYKITIFIGPWVFEMTDKGIKSNDDRNSYNFPNNHYIMIDTNQNEAIICDENKKFIMGLKNIQMMKHVK